MDFSKLDLSELFQDLKTSFSPQAIERMQTKAPNRSKHFQNEKGGK